MVKNTFWSYECSSIFSKIHREMSAELSDDFVFPYLDDLLIYSASFDDRLVFERLCQFGVKGKTSKCQFFKHKVHI